MNFIGVFLSFCTDNQVKIPLDGPLLGKPRTYQLTALTPGHTYLLKLKSVGVNSSSKYTDTIESHLPPSGTKIQ